MAEGSGLRVGGNNWGSPASPTFQNTVRTILNIKADSSTVLLTSSEVSQVARCKRQHSRRVWKENQVTNAIQGPRPGRHNLEQRLLPRESSLPESSSESVGSQFVSTRPSVR